MKTPSFTATLQESPPVVITWEKGEGFKGELEEVLNAEVAVDLRSTFRPPAELAREVLLKWFPDAVISDFINPPLADVPEGAET